VTRLAGTVISAVEVVMTSLPPPQPSRRGVLAALAMTARTLAGPRLAAAGSDLRVDRPSPAVREIARRLTPPMAPPRERALALYRFVRDEIRFGFTDRFDLATPDETLTRRRGHCNPQAALFASLCHAAGLEARVHFVTIADDILAGIFPGRAAPPPRLTHSFTELRLDDRWIHLDGYIVDPALHAAALAQLRREGRRLGYGVHADGRIEWDGTSDCMAQFVSPAMLAGPDHGTFVDLAAFYHSAAYTQRLNVVTGLLYRTFAVPPANATLDRLRSGAGLPA
jgi:hypothetical protein